MICRTVKNYKGEEYLLTIDEEKYVRALERLSKMDSGRLELMANGTLSIRINGCWHEDNIDNSCNIDIRCEGGEGGD